MRLEKFGRNSVKHIYCSFGNSFALTFDGLVYSWGNNNLCCLGHELNRDEFVFEPKLINISKVISVGISSARTYFLRSVGDVYYCGLNEDQNDDLFQKSPKLFGNGKYYIQFLSISVYRTMKPFMGTLHSDHIETLDENVYKKIHESCYEEFKMTYNTLVLDIKITQILRESKIDEKDVKFEKSVKTFQNRFVKLNELSAHTLKVEDSNTRTLFAVKQIELKGKH